MRMKKNTKRRSVIDNSYFGNISKKSIKKDFEGSGIKKQINEVPKVGSEKRIISISERSDYYRYKHLINGKLVRIVDQSSIGFNSFICSFVFDEDRIKLNKSLGYTDKKEYLLEGIKFK